MNDGPISPTQYICKRMNFTGKRLSKSIMCHNRLDLCQEDKKTQSERNNIPWSGPRMKCYCIHSSLSQYILSFLFFSSFSPRLHAPFFMEAIPLYSLTLFDHSLLLVNYEGDLLDACPIRILLETL